MVRPSRRAEEGEARACSDGLRAAMAAIGRGLTPEAAVIEAAERLSASPWAVVQGVGPLARARWSLAPEAVGLTASLRKVAPGSGSAVLRVEAGQPCPAPDRAGCQRRGAFDTPAALARRLAAHTIGAARRTRSAQDPACGVGALLVALRERGVRELRGGDLDPLAVAVARVALPGASLEVRDALEPGERTDLLVGNPPFLSTERQGLALRAALRARFPWLSGRFDLALPMAEAWSERVEPGGALGLWMPWSCFCEGYGRAWRRRWLERHAVCVLEGPEGFRGAATLVGGLVVRVGAGPAVVAHTGIDARVWAALPQAPFDPELRTADVDLLAQVRAASVALGELARVDTGVVSHGGHGGKAGLLHDEPGPGRVPYGDAQDFFAGRRRWLRYAPELMHRAKSPSLFERPKVVVQRIVSPPPVRAWVDREGVYPGHTCTVVVPDEAVSVPLEAIAALLRDPLVRGLLRVERGPRVDMYPRDVGAVPVPRAWLGGAMVEAAAAWGLSAEQVARLRWLGGAGAEPAMVRGR